MLGKKTSRRASSRSARLSSSISHTVATRRQRPTGKVSLTDRPAPRSKKSTSASRGKPAPLSRQERKNLKARAARRLHLEPKKLSAPEYSLLGILAASCACIIAALIADASFDPAKNAMSAMSSLADDYYIEFLYPLTLGSQIDDPAPILSQFTESGLPSVRLSHLLLYNDASHASYASYFNNKYYKCDVAHSYFNFYPVAPYGPRNYTVKYSPSCEAVL